MFRVAIVYDDRCSSALGAAWRVKSCVDWSDNQRIVVARRALYMTVPRKMVPGHLCNPRKLLAEYWRRIRSTPPSELIYFGKAA